MVQPACHQVRSPLRGSWSEAFAVYQELINGAFERDRVRRESACNDSGLLLLFSFPVLFSSVESNRRSPPRLLNLSNINGCEY